MRIELNTTSQRRRRIGRAVERAIEVRGGTQKIEVEAPQIVHRVFILWDCGWTVTSIAGSLNISTSLTRRLLNDSGRLRKRSRWPT